MRSAPGRDAARPPGSAVAGVVSVVLWRALVCAFGFIGWAFDVADLNFLSQISSLIVGVYFGALVLLPVLTRGRRIEEPDPFVRMVVTVTTWIVGVVFATLLGADYSTRTSLFMHLIVPVATALDVIFVGRNLARAGRWHVLTLPLGPLLYLPYALAQSPRPYVFLDEGAATLASVVVSILIGIWLAGLALVGVGRLRGR